MSGHVQGSQSPLMIGPALQGMQSCQKVRAAQDPPPPLEAEGEAGDFGTGMGWTLTTHTLDAIIGAGPQSLERH